MIANRRLRPGPARRDDAGHQRPRRAEDGCARRTSMADLPVIMATAKDQSEDIVEALKLGANDYVTKPLDFPVVLARVQTQLALKRQKDEIQRLAEDLEVAQPISSAAPSAATCRDEVVESLLESPEGLKLGGREAHGHDPDVRPAGLHVHLRAARPRAGRADAQQLPGRDDRDHHELPGHHRRVHRRRDPGHLRSPDRRARTTPAGDRLRGRDAARHGEGQRRERARGPARDRDGDRRPHRRGGGRQHRVRSGAPSTASSGRR